MIAKQEPMSAIICTTTLFKINAWTIVRLPEEASTKLPSRGQVMIEGTINGVTIRTPLEPDGRWSHWFRAEPHLLKAMHASAGDSVDLVIKATKDWPEPDVPADLQHALTTDTKAHELWKSITPMARWEWIRWARATNSQETYRRRIKVGVSKLKSGERRPCCWNRNLCTEPSVSKNGVLLQPLDATD